MKNSWPKACYQKHSFSITSTFWTTVFAPVSFDYCLFSFFFCLPASVLLFVNFPLYSFFGLLLVFQTFLASLFLLPFSFNNLASLFFYFFSSFFCKSGEVSLFFPMVSTSPLCRPLLGSLFRQLCATTSSKHQTEKTARKICFWFRKNNNMN